VRRNGGFFPKTVSYRAQKENTTLQVAKKGKPSREEDEGGEEENALPALKRVEHRSTGKRGKCLAIYLKESNQQAWYWEGRSKKTENGRCSEVGEEAQRSTTPLAIQDRRRRKVWGPKGSGSKGKRRRIHRNGDKGGISLMIYDA